MKWVKLQDVAAPVKNAIVDGPFGSNMKLSDYVEHGVPVLQGKNITNDRFRWFEVRFISEAKAEELGRSKVRRCDLLIVKIGSIGYSAILDDLNGFAYGIIPANIAKVTLNEHIVYPSFMAYYLSSPESKNRLKSLASKTAQPALSLTKIKEFPIPLPPLPIQKQIAAILEKADAARKKRRKANQLTEQFLQSAFLEMFGDPVINPKGWDVKPFAECIDTIRYATGSPPPYVDEGIPFIRATNVKGGTIVKNELRYISPEDAATISKCKVNTGDLILVRSGVNAGDCAVIPKEFDGGYAAYDLIIELPMVSAIFYNHLINSTFGETILEPLKRRAGEFVSGVDAKSIQRRTGGIMANTNAQVEAEKWIRKVEVPKQKVEDSQRAASEELGRRNPKK